MVEIWWASSPSFVLAGQLAATQSTEQSWLFSEIVEADFSTEAELFLHKARSLLDLVGEGGGGYVRRSCLCPKGTRTSMDSAHLLAVGSRMS